MGRFPSSSTQSHPLCLFPLLQEHPTKEPPPAPPALPQGGQVQGDALRPRLHVRGGGKRGSGGAQLISGCGCRSAREGSDPEQHRHLLRATTKTTTTFRRWSPSSSPSLSPPQPR